MPFVGRLTHSPPDPPTPGHLPRAQAPPMRNQRRGWGVLRAVTYHKRGACAGWGGEGSRRREGMVPPPSGRSWEADALSWCRSGPARRGAPSTWQAATPPGGSCCWPGPGGGPSIQGHAHRQGGPKGVQGGGDHRGTAALSSSDPFTPPYNPPPPRGGCGHPSNF